MAEKSLLLVIARTIMHNTGYLAHRRWVDRAVGEALKFVQRK